MVLQVPCVSDFHAGTNILGSLLINTDNTVNLLAIRRKGRALGMVRRCIKKSETVYHRNGVKILNLKVNAKILAWLLREAFNISLNIVISFKMK